MIARPSSATARPQSPTPTGAIAVPNAQPIAAVGLDSPLHSPDPALPSDHDETAGVTGGVPSTVVQQGSRDLKRGIVDTSRAPEAEAAYRKLKRRA